MTDRQCHGLPITKRKALLPQAGHNPNHSAYRVYHFITKMVQIDVQYVIARQTAKLS